MATHDRQILGTGSSDAPLTYTVPASAELLLKAVRATFTDNGAVAAWLPAVELVSDSGDGITLAADQAVKVAAGGGADVSWFPGVKHSAAATATGVEWFWAKKETSLTINAGDHKFVSWVTSKTSDPTLFSLVTGHGTGSDAIQVARPGVTLASCYCNPAAPANWQIELLLSGDNEVPLGSAGSNWLTDANADNTPAGLHNNPRDFRLSVGTASPFNLWAEVFNLSAAPHAVAAFYIGVFWWPNATLWA